MYNLQTSQLEQKHIAPCQLFNKDLNTFRPEALLISFGKLFHVLAP